MKLRVPLRVLNEQSSFAGLGMWDICGVGYVFVASHTVLDRYGLGLAAFLIAGLSFAALSFVRTTYRTRIMRDAFGHSLGERVIYDPTTRQN